MEVTDAYKSDAVQLGNLLESLHLDDIEAVATDSAYLSRRNCDLVEAIGAKPFINLKCNVKGRVTVLLHGGGWFMIIGGIPKSGNECIIFAVQLSRRFLRLSGNSAIDFRRFARICSGKNS
jgi:hypothetical protein